MKYRFLVIVLAVLLTSTLSYGQSKTYNSIRQVDFLNFTFSLSWCAKEFKELPTRVTVKNGRFEIDDDTYVDVEKKAILYTDFTGDNIEEAVVPVNCGPLHANYSGYDEILVFTLRNGKPELLTSLNEDIFERDYRRYYPSKGTSLYLSPESGIKVDHCQVSNSLDSYSHYL